MPLHWPVNVLSFTDSLLQYMNDKAMKFEISLLSTTSRMSRDVNKHPEDLVFSLTKLQEAGKASHPENVFIFFEVLI